MPFLSRIELLIGFEKSNVWAVCTRFEYAKSDNMYFIVTSSLEQSILVSLRVSVCKVIHIYPKQFDQALHVNVSEPFVGDFGKEKPAPVVYIMTKKDGYPPRT